MTFEESVRGATRYGCYYPEAFARYAAEIDSTLTLPQAYDAWRESLGLPTVTEVDAEIARLGKEQAFIASHNAAEVADWIRSGCPV